jgi:Tol biopolymer transport system component
MKALIWKEWRALGTRAILALIMTTVLVTTLAVRHAGDEDLRAGLIIGVCAIALPLLSAGLGCFMLARERARGELCFSSSWPASKGQAWAAKLVAGLAVLVVGYAVTAGLALACGGEVLTNRVLGSPLWWVPVVVLHAAACFMLFGVGFALSGIRTGPFDALLSSLLALMLVSVGLGFFLGDWVPRRWGPQLGICVFEEGTFPGALGSVGAVILGGICIVASAFGAVSGPPLAFGRKHWRTVILGLALGVIALPLMLIGVRVLGEPRPEEMRLLAWASSSRDGKWIALADVGRRQRIERADYYLEGPRRLWVMRSDGSGLRCAARWPMQWAEWSPDSRWLVVKWGRGATAGPQADAGNWLWIWDAQRSALHKMPWRWREGYSTGGVWLASPRGKYLLNGLDFVRLGAEPRLVPAELPQSAQMSSALVGWSEDETSFYFSQSSRKTGRIELWSADLPSGGNLRRVAQGPEGRTGSVRTSPDGKWVAWVLRQDERRPGEQHSVDDTVLENLEDGRQIHLEGLRPWGAPWSPDMRCFWVTDQESVTVVGLPEGRVLRTLTGQRLQGTPQSLAWSPDGKRRLVQAVVRHQDARGYTGGSDNALWVANADGSGLKRVAQWSEEARPMLAHTARSPAGWAGDGKVLMLEQERRLVAIDPDSGDREVILEAPVAEGGTE